MSALTGRVAVVTGASRGIGAATAAALAGDGARVVRLARSLRERRDGQSLDLRCDVTDAAQVRAAADLVLAEWGPPDILVNNAGAFHLALRAQEDRYVREIAEAEDELQRRAVPADRLSLLSRLETAGMNKSAFIESTHAEDIAWNDILHEIREMVPETVVLASVGNEPGGLVRLSGMTRDLKALSQFGSNIQNAVYVTRPKFEVAEWDHDLNALVFTLTCRAKGVSGQ